MPNKSTEVYIKCPFYLSENRNFISCEGFVADTCMTTRFPDAESKKEHLRTHCFLEDGGDCGMATGLFAKYGVVVPVKR